jgi:hypothetical protein
MHNFRYQTRNSTLKQHWKSVHIFEPDSLSKSVFVADRMCDVTPYSMVYVYLQFGGKCFLHLQGRSHSSVSSIINMEAANSSETSVNIYHQATWHRITADSNLHTDHRENLKSHMRLFVFHRIQFSDKHSKHKQKLKRFVTERNKGVILTKLIKNVILLFPSNISSEVSKNYIFSI